MDGRDADSKPLWLLLLPVPSSTVSLASIMDAYEAPLAEVLRTASDASQALELASLDIAIQCPTTPARDHRPRSFVYADAQHLLGLIYKTICLITLKERIDVQYQNDIDVRISILGSRLEGGSDVLDDGEMIQGPLLDMQTLALCRRPWKRLYSLGTEDGETLITQFFETRKTCSDGRGYADDLTVKRVEAGYLKAQDPHLVANPSHPPTHDNRHYSVAVGGTFDHLHPGHKLLLTATALILEPRIDGLAPLERSLTIGITGDELLKNKQHRNVMESWDERQRAVCQFMLAILSFTDDDHSIHKTKRFADSGANGKAIYYHLQSGLILKCVEISDPFGPTITDRSISALVISGETRAGGEAVNEKRVEKGWRALEVFEVDVLDTRISDDAEATSAQEDFQGKISSTEIRRRLAGKGQGQCAIEGISHRGEFCNEPSSI
ncbi:hypothetical protein MMC20_006638 [Loxospora ochrophaea]|nr:hypothetical protein [Loxospora ochrophaea]